MKAFLIGQFGERHRKSLKFHHTVFHLKYIFFSVSGKCVLVAFSNKCKQQVKINSSLKPLGYIITGTSLKLKNIIRHPELHPTVTFSAVDPSGQRSLLVNGQMSMILTPKADCSTYTQIEVTPGNILYINFMQVFMYNSI